VSGTVTYDFLPALYDPVNETGGFGAATEKPVRAAVVQVLRGATVLGTPTSTDPNGHYALTFDDPGGAGNLAVVALAKTAGAPSIQVQDNTDGNAIWAVGAPLDPNATTLNLRATSGWTGTHFDAAKRTAAPFAVLDSMYGAAMAYVAARPSVIFPALQVNWSPQNAPGGDGSTPTTGNIGTSHFSRQDNQIYVLGADQVDTDEFDSHVIVHEWAHFFDRNVSRGDSPGGSHGPGELLDPRLAFSEGNASAFAAMVLPHSMYVDTNWSGPGGALAAFGFDAETEPSPTDDPRPGAFSETSVMRLLYDLFDPANEAFDGIALGLGSVYDVLTGHQKNTRFLTTIGSFVTGVRALPGVNGSALDDLLARYQIGPITTDYGTGDTLGGDTGGLEAMYVHVTDFPTSTGIQLGGNDSANKWSQNQYYWFTGTGDPVTIEVTSTEDIMLHGYEDGGDLGFVDDVNGAGTEIVSGPTTAGTICIIDLVGFPTPNDNDITLRFTSP
jgi:hypothetical protein